MNMKTFFVNIKERMFDGITVLEGVEYALLLMMTVVLPYDWQLMMWLLPLFVVNAAVRVAVARRVGNPALGKGARWTLWLLVAFYVYQLVSMLYSSNHADGWDMIVRRLPMLVMPVCLLCVDTKYFDSEKRRALMWVFTLSLTVKFLFCFVRMLVVHHGFVFSSTFDAVHHSYVSLYLLLAMGFVYSEWLKFNGSEHRAMRCVLYAIAIMLAAYMVIVVSRAGIAAMAVMLVAMVLHQFFGLHETRRGMVMVAAFAICGVSAYFLLPDNMRRLTKTFDEMTEGDTSDARYLIFGSSLKAIGESMPFGVGIGDKNDVLAEVYEDTGNDKFIAAQYNSHNIYLDAMLTMGIPGLVLLLSFFAVPAVAAWRRGDIVLLSYVFAVAFSGLFEAIMNRQMGIMFVALFSCLVCMNEEVEPERLLHKVAGLQSR